MLSNYCGEWTNETELEKIIVRQMRLNFEKIIMVRETNETELKLETHKICIIIGDDDDWSLSVHVPQEREREREVN